MYNEIAANKRKTWFILFAFLVLVGLISMAASYYFFGTVYATIGVMAMAIAYALFSYFGAAKMATSMSGAKQIQKQDNPRLYNMVENLAISQGMPMPKVYIMEDDALNAFATGRNPENAVVAATTGLLNELTDTELEGVMAHEMGHVKNYDIRVSMIAFALTMVISLIADFMMRSLFWGGNRDEDRDSSGLIVIIGVAASILAPLVASAIRLAITRRREYLADATGALATRYPEGLASALEKIGGRSTMKKQHTATAHLFISSPLSKEKFAHMFSTHPPIADRVNRLRSMSDRV